MSSNVDERLLGQWRTDPSDVKALEQFGHVSLEFEADGSLRYTVHEDEKDSMMLLSYRVEGDTLITDQPSSPSEERTTFWFSGDGKLVLDYGGAQATYIR